MKKIVGIIFVLLVIGAVITVFLMNRNGEILSPLGIVRNITQKREYKTMAFLPNWSAGKYTKMPEGLDEVVYWDDGAEKADIKYGGRKILGLVKIMTTETIDYDKEYEDIVQRIKDSGKKWDGINIDYEFNSNPIQILGDDFLNFLEKLKKSLKMEIGVDIFVNTINKGDKKSLDRLFSIVDEVIVMAYDFHRPSSTNAGPVAPLNAPVGQRSIMEMVEKVNNINLDASKIVMAYPLYGYEWKTKTADYGAETEHKWYQVASIKRVKEVIAEKNLTEQWNEEAASPWVTYEENGQIYQIYYENEKSLKIKMEVVVQNKFKGVGFWALGYEGDSNLFNLLTKD